VRVFKFRFYDHKISKEMIYQQSYEAKNVIFDKWETTPKCSSLMQYTGIKDNNNMEIYEGDIVQYKQRNLEAAFGMAEGEDYIEKTREIKYSGQSFNVPQGFIKDLEVIGNIYETNKN
jgi:uncharacterized phage protein (TIGR01671 family)